MYRWRRAVVAASVHRTHHPKPTVEPLSHTYAVKSSLVTMVRPKFAPQKYPSRRPIAKPQHLSHSWTRPTYDAKRHPDSIRRLSTMHWSVRHTYRPTERSRESLTTISRSDGYQLLLLAGCFENFMVLSYVFIV